MCWTTPATRMTLSAARQQIPREILHSTLLFGEPGCNVVLEQEATLSQLFEYLVRGRFVFGFDALDMTIDLVVGCCKPPEFVIRFR
jgi:hypothetical protein